MTACRQQAPVHLSPRNLHALTREVDAMSSMLTKVREYSPSEQDYRIWPVVNPKVWLIPILFAVLVVGLAVHAYVLNLSEYTW
jgi:light-harvesting complex 1 alpha chain